MKLVPRFACQDSASKGKRRMRIIDKCQLTLHTDAPRDTAARRHRALPRDRSSAEYTRRYLAFRRMRGSRDGCDVERISQAFTLNVNRHRGGNRRAGEQTSQWVKGGKEDVGNNQR